MRVNRCEGLLTSVLTRSDISETLFSALAPFFTTSKNRLHITLLWNKVAVFLLSIELADSSEEEVMDLLSALTGLSSHQQ